MATRGGAAARPLPPQPRRARLSSSCVQRGSTSLSCSSARDLPFPLPLVPGSDGAGVRRDTGEEIVVFPGLGWGDREDAPRAASRSSAARATGPTPSCRVPSASSRPAGLSGRAAPSRWRRSPRTAALLPRRPQSGETVLVRARAAASRPSPSRWRSGAAPAPRDLVLRRDDRARDGSPGRRREQTSRARRTGRRQPELGPSTSSSTRSARRGSSRSTPCVRAAESSCSAARAARRCARRCGRSTSAASLHSTQLGSPPATSRRCCGCSRRGRRAGRPTRCGR